MDTAHNVVSVQRGDGEDLPSPGGFTPGAASRDHDDPGGPAEPVDDMLRGDGNMAGNLATPPSPSSLDKLFRTAVSLSL